MKINLTHAGKNKHELTEIVVKAAYLRGKFYANSRRGVEKITTLDMCDALELVERLANVLREVE